MPYYYYILLLLILIILLLLVDNVKVLCYVSVDIEFAHLMKLLWNSRPGLPDGPVSPRKFKDKVAEFAKRFVGYRYVYCVFYLT